MYKDFSYQTILTGQVNDMYFGDFPDTITVKSRNQYRLTVQNRAFVFSVLVQDFDKQYQLCFLPGSRDYSVDFGDGYVVSVRSLKYMQAQQARSSRQVGDAYWDDPFLYIYDGEKFTEARVSQRSLGDFVGGSCVQLATHDGQVVPSPYIKQKTLKVSHRYSGEQRTKYTVKITGGFTGVDPSARDSGSDLISFISDVYSWGQDACWNTMNRAFAGCGMLSSLPDHMLPNVNDFTSAFYGCAALSTIPRKHQFLPPAMLYGQSMFRNSGISDIREINGLQLPAALARAAHMFSVDNAYTVLSSSAQKQYFIQKSDQKTSELDRYFN